MLASHFWYLWHACLSHPPHVARLSPFYSWSFLGQSKVGHRLKPFLFQLWQVLRIHTCSLSLRWHSEQVLGKATNSHILSSSWGAVITILEEAGLSPKLLYNAKLRSWYNCEIEHICWFRFCCHDTWRSRQCNGTSSCSLIFIKLKLTLKNTRV